MKASVLSSKGIPTAKDFGATTIFLGRDVQKLCESTLLTPGLMLIASASSVMEKTNRPIRTILRKTEKTTGVLKSSVRSPLTDHTTAGEVHDMARIHPLVCRQTTCHIVVWTTAAAILCAQTVTSAADTSIRTEAEECVDKGLAIGDNSDQEAAWYKRAIEIDPSYANAYFNLAYVLQVQAGRLQERYQPWEARKKLETAFANYRLCLQRDPKRRDALFNLYTIATSQPLQRWEDGYAALKRILDYYPSDPERDTIRKGIIKLERRIAALKNADTVSPEEIRAENVEKKLSRSFTRAASPYAGPRLPVRIEFELDSDRLLAKSRSTLDEIAKALHGERLRDKTILIEGHADSTGASDYNLALSRRRAESVKRYLVERCAIPENRLQVVGYGEDRPLKPNDAEENMAANRRVEFVNGHALERISRAIREDQSSTRSNAYDGLYGTLPTLGYK